MINKRNHQFVERKIQIFDLISINICEKFFLSNKKTLTFFENREQSFSSNMIQFFSKRTDAVAALRKRKLKTELHSEIILRIVRNDNVKKLKSILNKWYNSIKIIFHYIIVYNSIQNDIVERKIKTIENQIRAMIKNAKLSIKFWSEIGKTDVYIRNRVEIEFMMNENLIIFMKTFIRIKSFINHFRVWNCKYYAFVNSKFLTKNRKNKFMKKKIMRVFEIYRKNRHSIFDVNIESKFDQTLQNCFCKKWKIKKRRFKFVNLNEKRIFSQTINWTIIENKINFEHNHCKNQFNKINERKSSVWRTINYCFRFCIHQ